ncbi:hypothetical protein R5W24_005263 [Gemmata sp. JC717]|uniref:hypothetical protein n=1 Tax=Gemmata algarum TaxID=2975278 RepID=UPI0021BA8DCC|nr:hypothetical protein [Gemmata algarum]MDY3556100.1 hypothetical protein [Gemmata algarum]
MEDKQTVEFLTWLTEGGQKPLQFHSREPDQKAELWLGALPVTRADLSRIARHWAGLTPEIAGALADRCFARIQASEGGTWRPAI